MYVEACVHWRTAVQNRKFNLWNALCIFPSLTMPARWREVTDGLEWECVWVCVHNSQLQYRPYLQRHKAATVETSVDSHRRAQWGLAACTSESRFGHLLAWNPKNLMSKSWLGSWSTCYLGILRPEIQTERSDLGQWLFLGSFPLNVVECGNVRGGGAKNVRATWETFSCIIYCNNVENSTCIRMVGWNSS